MAENQEWLSNATPQQSSIRNLSDSILSRVADQSSQELSLQQSLILHSYCKKIYQPNSSAMNKSNSSQYAINGILPGNNSDQDSVQFKQQDLNSSSQQFEAILLNQDLCLKQKKKSRIFSSLLLTQSQCNNPERSSQEVYSITSSLVRLSDAVYPIEQVSSMGLLKSTIIPSSIKDFKKKQKTSQTEQGLPQIKKNQLTDSQRSRQDSTFMIGSHKAENKQQQTESSKINQSDKYQRL